MIVNTHTTGMTVNVNVEMSKKSDDDNSESIKKEHASVHDSGQPPNETSELKESVKTKSFPTKLVVTLIIMVVVLSALLACLSYSDYDFADIINLLKEVFIELFKLVLK